MLRPGSALILAACLATVSPITAADDDLERLSDIADEDFLPIDRPLDRAPFYHAKTLTVTKDALVNGWVRNHQCHRHFSVTPSLEIVFPSDKIRHIEITDSSNIGDVQVRDHTIQLKDVNEQSALCFTSENHLLQRESDGSYRITAGPFYYRFLDGYFPIEVDLTVRYPPLLLDVLRLVPRDRPGVEVSLNDGEVRLWSRFEGALWVHVLFERK
jgi:hypothetical protein